MYQLIQLVQFLLTYKIIMLRIGNIMSVKYVSQLYQQTLIFWEKILIFSKEVEL